MNAAYRTNILNNFRPQKSKATSGLRGEYAVENYPTIRGGGGLEADLIIFEDLAVGKLARMARCNASMFSSVRITSLSNVFVSIVVGGDERIHTHFYTVETRSSKLRGRRWAPAARFRVDSFICSPAVRMPTGAPNLARLLAPSHRACSVMAFEWTRRS
jgi:hypothetical protein